jgi:glucose-1-phosphate cytidylyltransferase
MEPSRLTVVILCGGKGMRAYPHTAEIPKVLMEVRDRPILRHVMDVFAAQGVRRFVLAAGFKAELVESFAGSAPAEWKVTVSDSGEDAATGERLWACRSAVGDPFLATYGDGLGNVDVGRLLAFHSDHRGAATLTAVPLRSQYGTVEADSTGQVTRFLEKPVLEGQWINGGFFAFSRSVFDHWSGADLEQEVLPGLAGAGLLYSYRHTGFWRSMDTYKDALELSELAARDPVPWLPPN